MELTTAMLADAAQVAGGKLYVLGGQWDRLMVAGFPAVHPAMAVVLVIRVEYTEAPQTFQLHAGLTLDGQPQDAQASGQLATGHSPGQAAGAWPSCRSSSPSRTWPSASRAGTSG